MRHLISIPSSITWCFRRSAALVDMTMASTTSRPMCRTLADGTGTICSRCSQSFWVCSQCCREQKKPMVTMVYVRSSVLFPVFPVLWCDPRKESDHRNPTAVLSVVAVAGYRPASWVPRGPRLVAVSTCLTCVHWIGKGVPMWAFKLGMACCSIKSTRAVTLNHWAGCGSWRRVADDEVQVRERWLARCGVTPRGVGSSGGVLDAGHSRRNLGLLRGAAMGVK